MTSPFVLTLSVFSGTCWTIVYLNIIYRGFKDKTYGMPLFALAFNLSWEFIFGFLEMHSSGIQQIINIVWFAFDAVIVYTYLRYGRKEFEISGKRKWFLPWSILALGIGFATIYAAALEFEGAWGSAYAAFAQNLFMSILFIDMLARRKNISGQSIYIAIFKWLGTAAPTILVYTQTDSKLALVLGMGCFVYDAIYTGMLYKKFRDLGLNPFTRKSMETG